MNPVGVVERIRAFFVSNENLDRIKESCNQIITDTDKMLDKFPKIQTCTYSALAKERRLWCYKRNRPNTGYCEFCLLYER